MTTDETRAAFEKHMLALGAMWPGTINDGVGGFYYNDPKWITAWTDWQAATAASEEKYLPVIRELVEALEYAQPCVKPLRIQAVDNIIADALALAAPLLGEKA